VKWASEEPGQVAKRFLPAVDYPAVVRRCLGRDTRSFRHLLALSAHTDAAASELQPGILGLSLSKSEMTSLLRTCEDHKGFSRVEHRVATIRARRANPYSVRNEFETLSEDDTITPTI
jgi:hypothetical protein